MKLEDYSPNESTFLIALGARIKARRESLGLRQRDLADRTRMHVTYIGHIEQGRRNVGVLNVSRLARGLQYEGSGQLLDGLPFVEDD